jgi:hypothetical protein
LDPAVKRQAKKDRTTLPMLAGLAGCGMAAYGFSRQSALFLWMLPLGLLSLSLLWVFWPRPGGRSPSSDAG